MPEQWLADGGYVAHEQIEAVDDKTVMYGPVPEPRAKKDQQGNKIEEPAQDKHAPKPGDSAPVARWRTRMGQPEAQAIYRDRAATAECVNALARNRGLLQMPVRGLPKVRCIALLYAPAHNLMRAVALTPKIFGLGTGTSAIEQSPA